MGFFGERPSAGACNPAIGIVGAGPGGLSLARMLTERGFRDVTLLERAQRVGGKSLTVPHEGLGHEVGTCYHTYGYTYVRRWMRECGMTAHRLRRHVIHRGDGGVSSFTDYVCPGPRSELFGELARYAKEWMRFFARQELGRERARFDAEVSVPFGQWLDERGFAVIKRFALRSMTAMGYGHLDQAPALYGLRWNTPSLLLSAAALRVDEPVPGWQHLWQSMAATMDVRLGWDTARVDREAAGIVVHSKDGRHLRFDHLVVTTPLDECGAFLPLAPEEERLFARFRWSQYVTSLVVAEGWFTEEDTHSFEASLAGADGARVGHVLVARRTGDKTPVSSARADRRKHVYVVYQYGNDQLSEATLRQRLEEDVAREGGRVVEVLGTWRWRYSPKLAADAIATGAVWALEALQGRRNTWYTGACMSHEAVDTIVDYNVKLADRMEHTLRGYAARPLGNHLWYERRTAERLLTWHNK